MPNGIRKFCCHEGLVVIDQTISDRHLRNLDPLHFRPMSSGSSLVFSGDCLSRLLYTCKLDGGATQVRIMM